jgi:hypothetical protein
MGVGNLPERRGAMEFVLNVLAGFLASVLAGLTIRWITRRMK